MFKLSRLANDKYRISVDSTALGDMVMPDSCLFRAMLELLLIRTTSKSTALLSKRALSLIASNIDKPELRKLLFTPNQDTTVNDVIAGKKEITMLIDELPLTVGVKSSLRSNLRALLSATGFQLSDGRNIKAVLRHASREQVDSSVTILSSNIDIVHPKSPELEAFTSSGGLLETCFDNTKWSVYSEAESTVPIWRRQVISKALRFLANQDALPETTSLFRSPPHKITPRMIYKAYKEIESTLPAKNTSSALSRNLRRFLEESGCEISDGQQMGCIYYQTRFTGNGILPYTADNVFTLQKLTQGGYVVFDNDRLDGLLTPGGLLLTALQTSCSTPIHYSTIQSFRNLVELIACSNTSLLKRFLKTKRNYITRSMVIDALIEFESYLERKTSFGRPDHNSSVFRSILSTWTGPIAGANHLHDVGFQTRFNKRGQVKCISPISLSVVDDDGKHSTVKFDTLQTPNLYLKKGLLAQSLLAAKKQSQVVPLPAEQVQHWLELLEHFHSHYEMTSKKNGSRPLLNSPLSKTGREKAMNGLKAIEDLIELRQNSDHEVDFISVLSLLSYCGEAISDGRLLSELNFRSRFSPAPERTVILFTARKKENGKPRITRLKFDITDIESWATANGLLMAAIQRAAKDSVLAQPSAIEFHTVFKVIQHIHDALNASNISINNHKANQPLRHLLASPANQLRKREVVLGLKRLEDILEQHPIKPGKRSELFRRFLNDYGGSTSNGLTIGQCGFKTRFSVRKERDGIELIKPVAKNGRPLKSPVLMPHTSTKQLKDRLNEYYQKPIDAINTAIRSEFALFKKLRSEMEPMVKRGDDGNFLYLIPEPVRDFVQESASGRKKGYAMSKMLEHHRNDVLAAFLQLQVETPLEQTVLCEGKSFLISSEYRCWFRANGTSMASFFWAPFLLPRPILLGCFLRLMIHTTWNKDVIASLTGADIPYPLPPGRFFIQGFKDKVGKSTKPVEVTPAQTDVREAIELIGKHHANMVTLGLRPNTVWDTPWSSSLSFLNRNTRDSLIERYGLPEFKIEQLAKHMINVREGVDGDIRRSQIERNHEILKTTAGYVDHPLARAYHDANNAEFQRQLEATVQVRHDGTKSFPEYGLSTSDINLRLLQEPSQPNDTPSWFVLPDGSTCTDIWAPVDKTNKSQRLCGGRKCHSGDGCPHNTVIIGPDEFANTLRKQRWFLERCDALLLKHTREYFDAFIAPEMRFIFGLVRYIEVAEPELYQQSEQLLNTTLGSDE